MEEEYQNDGIRHIEIQCKQIKEDKLSDNSEIDSDLGDSFDQVLLKNKKMKHSDKILNGNSDNVNLDSLLKAVIDISDRLNEQEDKIQKYEQQIQEDEMEIHKSLRSSSARPRTAVMKYNQHDYRQSDEDSDTETVRTSSKFSTTSSTRSRMKKRPISAKSMQSDDPSSRLSMSFSNDTVRRIDMENQRLLKEILGTKVKDSPTKSSRPLRVKSAATINRERKQNAIDRENMRLLSRLQAVKPTNGLRREKLMMDHMKNEKTVDRLSRTKQRPVSAPVSRSKHRTLSRENNFDTASVTSSRVSSAAPLRSSKSSRVSSAHTKTPKKVVVKEYWEPGW